MSANLMDLWQYFADSDGRRSRTASTSSIQVSPKISTHIFSRTTFHTGYHQTPPSSATLAKQVPQPMNHQKETQQDEEHQIDRQDQGTVRPAPP